MEQEIHFTTKEFDFSKVSISQPVSVQGGAYFTKIKYESTPLYIQTNKCLTKQGLNETSKRAYIDLMYTNDDDEIIEWFESLETKLIDLIYSKRELWFQNEMDMTDIESYFNPITRAFKGGKYQLVRVNIPKNKTMHSQYNCNMYDENETSIPVQELNDNQHIIPILEIQGIKFSARSFQIEVVGKQIMLLTNKPLFNSCMIRKDSLSTPPPSKDVSSVEPNSIHKPDSILEPDNKESLDELINEDAAVTTSEQNENIVNDLLDDKSLGDNEADQDDTDSVDNENGSTIKPAYNSINEANCDNVDDTNNLDDTNNHNNLDDANNVDDANNINNLDDANNADDANNINNINNLDDNDGYNNDVSNQFKNNNSSNRQDYLEEVSDSIQINETSSTNLKLKQPSEVYYEIYKITKEKAKQHKKAAIAHYLEAKKIKNSYLLEDMNESDDSSDDEYDISDSDKVKQEITNMVEEIR